MECHSWRWSGPELVTIFYVGSRSGFDLSQTTSGLLPGQGQMLMPDRGPFSTPDLASARHRSGWVVPGLAPVARNTWCLVWPGCEPDEIAIWVSCVNLINSLAQLGQFSFKKILLWIQAPFLLATSLRAWRLSMPLAYRQLQSCSVTLHVIKA